MHFYRFFLLIKCIFFMRSSTAFDILRVHYKDPDKENYGDKVLLHNVAKCARRYEKWGVTRDRMVRYSSDPVQWHEDDNDIFDCAWGCFFLKMEWINEDMEGSFQPPIMLGDLKKYTVPWNLTMFIKIASRCVYVNFPHTINSDHVPDCEQAKLLKDCLIKEEVLEVTAKNKVQFKSLMHDWLRVCADVEGQTLAEILNRAWHPPSKPDPDSPAIYGCPWRCLFYDMGWLEDVKGLLEVSVVRETIKLYYNETDKIPELLKHATRCALLANEYLENPSVLVRPLGCDRSQYLVDCLVTSFFKNNTVMSPSSTTGNTGRNIRIGRGGPARSPLRSAKRRPRPALSPPRKLGPPHHVRSRLRAQVVPLEPSDSIFVKVNITES